MRPYKFRAWDKKRKKWIDMGGIDIAFKMDADNPGVWYMVTYMNGKLIENRDIVTMHYTGLYDDTGEEICENDLVYAYKKGSGLNGYYKVVWDSIRGRWAYMNGDVHERYQVGKAGNMHCKIIGNEFDNPKINLIRKQI